MARRLFFHVRTGCRDQGESNDTPVYKPHHHLGSPSARQSSQRCALGAPEVLVRTSPSPTDYKDMYSRVEN